jgi:DNA-directed RNA polymerase specialized sigma24 family protein
MPRETWEELVAKADPRFVNEIPHSWRPWVFEQNQRAIPETELQALMETAPGEIPAETHEQQTTLSNQIEHIVQHDLSEEEKAVIETTIIAGHSIRMAAKILGWPSSTVHRLKMSALNRIREKMEQQ